MSTKGPIYGEREAPSIFADDLCRIETVGCNCYLFFASTEKDEDGKPGRRVELRLIVPVDQLQHMAQAMRAGKVLPTSATKDDGEPATVN